MLHAYPACCKLNISTLMARIRYFRGHFNCITSKVENIQRRESLLRLESHIFCLRLCDTIGAQSSTEKKTSWFIAHYVELRGKNTGAIAPCCNFLAVISQPFRRFFNLRSKAAIKLTATEEKRRIQPVELKEKRGSSSSSYPPTFPLFSMLDSFFPLLLWESRAPLSHQRGQSKAINSKCSRSIFDNLGQ